MVLYSAAIVRSVHEHIPVFIGSKVRIASGTRMSHNLSILSVDVVRSRQPPIGVTLEIVLACPRNCRKVFVAKRSVTKRVLVPPATSRFDPF